VKINGEMHYLWRALDHEGEVLESYVDENSRQSSGSRLHEEGGETPRQGGGDRHRWPPRDGLLGEQSGRKLPSAVPTTSARDAAIQANEDAAEVRLGTVRIFVREAGYRHQMTNRSPKITAPSPGARDAKPRATSGGLSCEVAESQASAAYFASDSELLLNR
jgi:hypothetical protein